MYGFVSFRFRRLKSFSCSSDIRSIPFSRSHNFGVTKVKRVHVGRSTSGSRVTTNTHYVYVGKQRIQPNILPYFRGTSADAIKKKKTLTTGLSKPAKLTNFPLLFEHTMVYQVTRLPIVFRVSVFAVPVITLSEGYEFSYDFVSSDSRQSTIVLFARVSFASRPATYRTYFFFFLSTTARRNRLSEIGYRR